MVTTATVTEEMITLYTCDNGVSLHRSGKMFSAWEKDKAEDGDYKFEIPKSLAVKDKVFGYYDIYSHAEIDSFTFCEEV